MATLEKIRSKQTLLFTIVIIALFLFIISIASADSIRRLFGVEQGPNSTIAQVGGHKISYSEYRDLIDKANQRQQKIDHDELSQLAINSLVNEALINEQIEQLGIRVTDKEISRAMTGAMPHPAASQFINMTAQYLQLPTPSGSAVLDAINNPGRYGLTNEQLNYLAQNAFGTPTMADAWIATEKAVEQNIQQQAFAHLINGLFTANKLDAQSAYDDNSLTSRISYVTAPYATVSDESVEVTDADIKAKYEQNKSHYKLAEETREIDYIIVPITASLADLDAAEEEVDLLVKSLTENPGVEGAVVSSKFTQDPHMVPVEDIKKDRNLALIPDEMIANEQVYKYRRSGNVWRVAKVIDVTNKIDDIKVSSFGARDAEQADSVMALLAAGKTFAELATEMPQQAMDAQQGSLIGAPDDLAEALTSAAIGKPFVYTEPTNGNKAVFMVSERQAAKPYANIVLYTYEVDPSYNTVNDIKTQLSSFLASNSNADDFSANADSLYLLRHATVTPSTPKLGYVPSQRGGSGYAETRHAIKWAMNAKKGQVSPIFDDNRDFFVVVALKDVYGDQYVPVTAKAVKDALTAEIKAEKKGAKLVEQYAGKANNIQDYAQLMGTEVRTDSTVVFGSTRLASLFGNQYALQGDVAAAQKGALVGPVKGANEVMVFVVDDVEATGRPFDMAQDSQVFLNTFRINDVYNMLLGERKVKNNTLQNENYDR